MKNQTIFELKTTLDKRTEKAFELISDPNYFPEFHPLITKVEKQNDHVFLFHETTSILFIPYSFQYLVTVTKNMEDHSVVMESEVQKGVWIKLIFSINNLGNEPVLSEKIEISGPFIIRQILTSKLKKAHHKMFENLKKKIQQNA